MEPIEQSSSHVDLGYKGPNDPFECKLFLAKIVYVHMKLKNNATGITRTPTYKHNTTQGEICNIGGPI